MNLECKVRRKIPLESNVLFLGEVVHFHVVEEITDKKGGVDLGKADSILFNLTSSYWRILKKLADYGFSRSRARQ